MSFKIIGSALDLPLIGNDKLVFTALCENADDTKRTCYPSYKTIQKKASLANSSLKTALEVLEAIGLIYIKIRSTKNGGRTSNLYTIADFDVEKFDVKYYKKIAKEIRAIRNFREKKDTQSPKTGRIEKYPNLRKSIQLEEPLQPPKIDTILDIQSPIIGEEPLVFSSQPLAFEEEGYEVEIVASQPPMIIPPCMAHIPVPFLELAIDKCVTKNSKKSRSGYRKALIKGLAVGDESWISEVSEFVKQVENSSEKPWIREHRLKRDQGQATYKAFEEAGILELTGFGSRKRGD